MLWSDLPLWLFGRMAVDCFELAMLKEVSNVFVRLYSTRRRVWWSAHAWWLEESPPVWCFLPKLSYLVIQNWGHLRHEWEWPQGQKEKLTLFPADALPAHWPNWTFSMQCVVGRVISLFKGTELTLFLAYFWKFFSFVHLLINKLTFLFPCKNLLTGLHLLFSVPGTWSPPPNTQAVGPASIDMMGGRWRGL